MGAMGREKKKEKERKVKERNLKNLGKSKMFITALYLDPNQNSTHCACPTQSSVLELEMLSLPVFVKICFSNTKSSHCERRGSAAVAVSGKGRGR